MAAYHEIPKPPQPKGDETEYRRQMHNYLWRLVETIQAVVNGLETLLQQLMEGGSEQ